MVPIKCPWTKKARFVTLGHFVLVTGTAFGAKVAEPTAIPKHISTNQDYIGVLKENCG